MSGFSVPVSSWLYNGVVAASGTLQVYQTGTTTHVNIYSDAGLTTPLSNPVTLDANGQVKFYVSGAVNLRLDGYTSTGTLIGSIDPVYPVSPTGTGTVVSQGSNFTLASSNNGNNIIATTGITITLPLTSTFSNSFAVSLNAQGGSITLAPNAADKINLGTAGASYVLAQGSSGVLWTDAAGNWGINFLSASITISPSYRNYLVNGAMTVWQRGATYALTNASANGSADRWAEYMSVSAAGIANRDTSVPSGLGFQYSMKMGRTAGSSLTGQITLFQALETVNSIPLQGKQVTISYYIKIGANYSGINNGVNVIVRTGTGTDQSAANGSAGSWTGDAIIISTIDTVTTSWQRFQHTATVSSSATQILAQLYYGGLGAAGADDNFYVTGIQLEIGSIASPFEFRQFEQDLSLCRRYYEKSFIYGTTPAQNAGTTGAITVLLPTGASGTFGQSIVMTPKRVAPTINTYNPNATNANWRDITNSADRTVTVGTIGENSFSISGASGAAASTNAIHWVGTAEL